MSSAGPKAEKSVSSAKPRGPINPSIGMCARCDWVREQPSKKGSVFYRCGRADEDDRFLRYPPLPVRDCAGFEPAESETGKQ